MAAHRDGFASLSSGLLARKGAARPAMRPHGGGLDDLGWNDMGGGPAAPKRAPITFAAAPVPEVVRQQDELAREFAPAAEAVPEPACAVEPSPLPDHARSPRTVTLPGARRAFTLRIDAGRHARLRRICAAERRSAQALLTEALDRLLADTEGCTK